MSLINNLIIKVRSLWEYYFFQKLGIPALKNEKISKSLLRKYLDKNPVIIDCGAHDGADSVELCKILGGTIHAFEPVPDIYKRLQKRTHDFPNIHTYQLALSNVDGHQFFYLSEGNSDASSSLLEPNEHLIDHPDTKFNNKIEVQSITLDHWAMQYKVSKVDMLWLDMQGFELAMLKESKNILSGVKVIHTEVSTRETYKGVPLYQEFKTFLESKGFKVAIEAIPSTYDMGNVLFVKNGTVK